MNGVLLRLRAIGLSALLVLLTILPAAAAVPAPALTVRVSDPSGQPVSGASVEVYGLDRGLLSLAQTGGDGTASLPYTLGTRQIWMLRLSAAGYRVAESGWFDPAYGGVQRFWLEPVGGDLQVLLHTQSGEQVAAQVALLTTGGRLAAQGKSDGGPFLQTGLPAGEYRLVAWAEGHAPAERTVAISPGRMTVESISLLPGGFTAVGEVVDSVTRKPVAGAALELLREDERLAGEGVTRSNGRFAISSPVAGETYRLRVTAPGYTPALTAPRGTEPGRALDFSGLDQVRLTPLTGSIIGTLLDEVGRPVGRTQVILLRDGFGEVAAAKSDDAGQFRFDRLPAGEGYRYQVAADSALNTLSGGYQHLLASDWITARPGVSLEVSVVSRSFYELPLSPAKLSGRVITPDGLPVEGAQVELIRFTRVQQRTSTNGAGGFAFAEVEASEQDGFGLAPYTLRISKEGFVATRQVSIAGEERTSFAVPVRGRVTAEVTMHPSLAELKGRVTDRQGRPVVGATVSLMLDDQASGMESTTDSGGWYSFKDVPAGSLAVLRVIAPDYLTVGGIDATPALVAGSPLPTVQLSPRTSILEGVLVDFGGKPVSGAKVTLWSDGAPLAEVQTGSDGYYLMESDLTAVRLALLTAGREGYTAGGAVLTELPGPGERASRSLLIQQAAAVLEGRVVDPAGMPVAAAEVEMLVEGRGTVRRVLSGPDGRYRFDQTLPGGAGWVWLRVRPISGSFAGSLSHGLSYAPLVRLAAGERMVIDLLVRP